MQTDNKRSKVSYVITGVIAAVLANGEIAIGQTCASNADCGGTTPYCYTSFGKCVACLTSAHCTDGNYCNGAEYCTYYSFDPSFRFCKSGIHPCTTDQFCDETNDRCDDCQTDADCDDGDFCSGDERCQWSYTQNRYMCNQTPRDCMDPWPCTTDSCSTSLQRCVHTPNHALCSNGQWCDGAETCSIYYGCQPGTAPNCNDGIACTADSCNESTDSCAHAPQDGDCDNGQWCDGAETCDPAQGCVAGSAPDCSDGVGCTIDSCNETTDACDHLPWDNLCSDGLWCNGAETCNATQDCLPGTPPDCDDGVACTVDTCDEASNACDAQPNDASCDNGDFCDGSEVCDPTAGCLPAPNRPCGGTCDELTNTCGHAGAILRAGNVVVGGTPVTVSLYGRFNDPVVVCTVQSTSNTVPVIARVDNVSGDSFDVWLQNPSGQPVVAETLHYVIAETGAWQHGSLKFEAQKYTSTVTDHSGSWLGEAQTYLMTYRDPVVLGQVMSANDANWSVFWAHNGNKNAPTPTTLRTGKHVGQDSNTVRADETVGFIVIEAGDGSVYQPNQAWYYWEAGVGPGTVTHNATWYTLASAAFSNSTPQVAVSSIAGMKGGDGAWARFISAMNGAAEFAVDEDQIYDAEQAHTNERLGYMVFSAPFAIPIQCGKAGDCNDGNYCNGYEQCVDTECRPSSSPPDCDDGNENTNDFCSFTLDDCVSTPAVEPFGTAVLFDGKNSFLDGGSPPELEISTEITVEAWIRPTAAQTGMIISKNGEFQLARWEDGTIRWAIGNTTPGWTWQGTNAVAPLNKWSHVAFTYDGSFVTVYLDGYIVAVVGASGPIQDQASPGDEFRIGAQPDGTPSLPFEGLIDEVRVWDFARTRGGIRATMFTSLTASEPGLIGYWSFDEGAGPLAGDLVYANDVQLHKAVWANAPGCDDGQFCTGREYSTPSGCTSSGPPCDPTDTCDEQLDLCVTPLSMSSAPSEDDVDWCESPFPSCPAADACIEPHGQECLSRIEAECPTAAEIALHCGACVGELTLEGIKGAILSCPHCVWELSEAYACRSHINELFLEKAFDCACVECVDGICPLPYQVTVRAEGLCDDEHVDFILSCPPDAPDNVVLPVSWANPVASSKSHCDIENSWMIRPASGVFTSENEFRRECTPAFHIGSPSRQNPVAVFDCSGGGNCPPPPIALGLRGYRITEGEEVYVEVSYTNPREAFATRQTVTLHGAGSGNEATVDEVYDSLRVMPGASVSARIATEQSRGWTNRKKVCTLDLNAVEVPPDYDGNFFLATVICQCIDPSGCGQDEYIVRGRVTGLDTEERIFVWLNSSVDHQLEVVTAERPNFEFRNGVPDGTVFSAITGSPESNSNKKCRFANGGQLYVDEIAGSDFSLPEIQCTCDDGTTTCASAPNDPPPPIELTILINIIPDIQEIFPLGVAGGGGTGDDDGNSTGQEPCIDTCDRGSCMEPAVPCDPQPPSCPPGEICFCDSCDASTCVDPCKKSAGAPAEGPSLTTTVVTDGRSGDGPDAGIRANAKLVVSASGRDSDGIRGYALVLDEQHIATTRTSGDFEPQDVDVSGLPEGDHMLYLLVTDDNPVSVSLTLEEIPFVVDHTTCLVDNKRPTGVLTSPTEGASIEAGQVNVTVSASDDRAVHDVSFEVDGLLVSSSVDDTPPYSYVWSASLGEHTLRGRIEDFCGNVGWTKSITVNVSEPCALDTTAPSFVFSTNPVAGATVSCGNVEATVSNVSDPNGVDRVEFYVNNVLKSTDTTTPYQWGFWYTIQGTYDYFVRVYDECGNVSQSATSRITVDASAAPCDCDTEPPSGNILAPADGATFASGATITVSGSAADNLSVFAVAFAIDGIVPAEATFLAPPYDYSWQPADGTHTILMKVQDQCGQITEVGPISVTVGP